VQPQDTPASKGRRVPAGIRERHTRDCATQAGKKRCSCNPSFEAVVSFARGQRQRKTFPTLHEAKAWRTRLLAAKTRSRLRAPTSITIREAADEYLAGMRDGTVTTRGGQTYKPSTIRSYWHSLDLHVLPVLGGRRAADLTTGDIQRLVERMRRDGQAGPTIANAINALRAIYRRLVMLGRVNDNPTRGAVVPSRGGTRLHAGDPADAARIIAAMSEQDRCVWALAFYAGLRLGELKALRWGDVDETGGVIRVRFSWDAQEGEIAPKSSAGVRDIPILNPLLPHLAAQRTACSWSCEPAALVLGASRRGAFGASGFSNRSAKALAAVGLEYVTLHKARHSFASYLAASGIGIKDLTVILGHSSVTVSLDRYGHLFESGKAQTAAQINAWLAAADTQSRMAQLEEREEGVTT
jgi:integrase